MEEIILEYFTWPELAEVLKQPNAIILPIGSIEQHGPHLPLNTDAANVTYVAEQTARKVTDENEIRVIVAPTFVMSAILTTPSSNLKLFRAAR